MWPLGSMMVNGESETCDDSSSQQGCTPPHCFSQPSVHRRNKFLGQFGQFSICSYSFTCTHTQSTAILLYQPLITSCTKVLLGHVMLCWVFFCTGVCAVLWRCMAAHPIADIAGGRMPIFCDVFLAGWLP